jgi:hypothetical protein
MAELYERVAAEAAAAVASFEEEVSAITDQGCNDLSHPKFGNYATLRLGIESHRAVQTWATWLASQLRQ